MTISGILRRERRRLALSQRELAGRAGVPQSTIARIESRTIEPRAFTIERILSALGLEPSVEPRWGEGVDRTLVRRLLAMTPRQRIEYGASAGEAMRRIRKAVSEAP